MIEPLFSSANQAALLDADPISARDSAALHRAIALAIESAFRFGRDFPVGAVALREDEIVGRGFAGDKRLGEATLHAEKMAIIDATLEDLVGAKPDTVVVTLEPCDNCQDFLAQQPELKRVVYGLSREDVARKGLVKPHAENISERSARLGLPYETIQVQDPQLREVGLMMLGATQRDLVSGNVRVDRQFLSAGLTQYNSL